MKDSYVTSISVYNDRIYTISTDTTVRVHDLEGRSITSWTPITHLSDQLVIINNQVVIPDEPNSTLVFYSLNGEVLKRIPLRFLFTDTPARMSAGDNNSIIISQYDSSLVYKIDTSSGDIIWQCTDVAKPCGVTCYREGVCNCG